MVTTFRAFSFDGKGNIQHVTKHNFASSMSSQSFGFILLYAFVCDFGAVYVRVCLPRSHHSSLFVRVMSTNVVNTWLKLMEHAPELSGTITSFITT